MSPLRGITWWRWFPRELGRAFGLPWDRRITSESVDAYAWAVVIAMVGLATRAMLSPWCETGVNAPFILCAVALTAYAFGLRPAVLTLVACALGFKFLFMGPRLSLFVPGWENRAGLAALLVGCLVVAMLFQRMRRLVDHLHAQQDLFRSLIDVQEKEKQFLCNELHDGLVQYAVGARMLLESHQRSHPHDAGTETLEAVIEYLRRGIEDGRRALRGIRPAVLDDGDLTDALTDLVDQFNSLGLAVTLRVPTPPGRLPETLQTTVYRVVQEALSNALRHSGAGSAHVDIATSGRSLTVAISDPGRGFDALSRRAGGFGLRGMAERIRLVGGSFTMHSTPDRGTRILAVLPLPAEQALPDSPPATDPCPREPSMKTTTGAYGAVGHHA